MHAIFEELGLDPADYSTHLGFLAHQAQSALLPAQAQPASGFDRVGVVPRHAYVHAATPRGGIRRALGTAAGGPHHDARAHAPAGDRAVDRMSAQRGEDTAPDGAVDVAPRHKGMDGCLCRPSS
jgi:hypothetical protein